MKSPKLILHRWVLFLAAALFLLAASQPAWAANLVQDFYLPMPEAQIYQANNAIISGTSSSILSTFSIVVTGDGTVIYYDQWEDGYETDLGNPTQSTTQIWGDGNDAHGIPPGFAHNPLGLTNGTVITLTNVVVLNNLSGTTPIFTAATLAPGAVASFTASYLAPTNCATVSVTFALDIGTVVV